MELTKLSSEELFIKQKGIERCKTKNKKFIIEDDDDPPLRDENIKEVIEIIKDENIKEVIEVIEGKSFLNNIYKTYNLYHKHGPTSSEKVNYFHNCIKVEIEKIIKNKLSQNIYKVKLEQNIDSINSSNKKKCDIVVFKNEKPYIVLPVKIIMTNYKQNKNNSWENLTGELIHLKWANPDIKIIPINILMNKTPYLKKNKIIDKFEYITYSDIKTYEILKEKDIAYDIINYIIDVDHENKIGENFCKTPNILNFNLNTKYRSFNKVLMNLFC